jgi:purine-binding chemotaxis protein CheW
MAQVLTNKDTESNAAVTQGTETRKSSVQQLIVFRLGGEEYGLAIEQVKEIVVTPNIARIPLMPSYVKGVANVRGNIMAIIDLMEKFNLTAQETSPTGESEKSYILVMGNENLKLGLLVREVPSTLSVNHEQIDNSPGLVQDGGESNYIKGIIRVGSRLIILIDVYKLISKEVLQSAASKHV